LLIADLFLSFPPAAKGGDDDDFDVFGDDDEADDEPKESRAEMLARLKKEAEERTAKKEAKQRTLVAIEVKPWDVEQDLMALWKKIVTTVKQDGLKWGESCTLVSVQFVLQDYGIRFFRWDCRTDHCSLPFVCVLSQFFRLMLLLESRRFNVHSRWEWQTLLMMFAKQLNRWRMKFSLLKLPQ
jgi:hypothetical protein